MNNSKFALLIAEKPQPAVGIVPETKWKEFLGSIQGKLPTVEGIQNYHDNVWLIPLKNGMPFLTHLYDWSHSLQIPTRILFLEDAPEWIKDPPE
jgi:hypothetical protein